MINATRRPFSRSVLSTMGAGAAALALTTVSLAAPVAQATEVPHAGAGFVATSEWTHQLNDPNQQIALSSPNVANLDGQPSVVVGDQAGLVYAYHLSGGAAPGGWPYNAGAPIDSSPSVAPINANGLDTVYIGSGDAATPTTGGYQAISPGGRRPVVRAGDQPGYRSDAAFGRSGVPDGRELRRWLRSRRRVTRPEHGRAQRRERSHARRLPLVLCGLGLLDRRRRRPLRGREQRDHHRWRLARPVSPTDRPTPTAGTCASSRAPAPPAPPTRPADSSASSTRTRTSTAPPPPWGSSSPEAASASPSATAATTGALRTRTRSSPSTPAAVLPGATRSTASRRTPPPWPTYRETVSSTSWRARKRDTIYVLNGTNGGTVWSAGTTGEVIGSPVTADLTGGGYQDVIVPTTNGIEIFDGRSGADVAVARHQRRLPELPARHR